MSGSKEEEETEENNLIQSTHVVQVKLADQQADPNSPLYSVKSFEELGLYGNHWYHINLYINFIVGALNF